MPSLNRLLNTIGRCGALYRARRLSDTEIEPGDHTYLFYLCHHPDVTQDELARALYVNKSSVTRHLSHLEQAGFLTRTPDPADRRALLVRPTQKALDILPRLREVGAEWIAALTADFSPEEQTQFALLLERAFENAQKAVREEGRP